MEQIKELDKRLEELEKQNKELKEYLDKKEKIKKLESELKKAKYKKEYETVNKVLTNAKSITSKLFKEINQGITKIQEHNRKQLEAEKKLKEKKDDNSKNKSKDK